MNINNLITELRSLKRASNDYDVLCEIALFEPDVSHRSIRANAAGTKVIYTDHDGNEETYWAGDWTTNIPYVISMLERKP